jgi:hypothetical protein
VSTARNAAKLDAIFGAQESGKSSLMKIETARTKPPRLMVWDPKREYAAFGQVFHKLAELAALVLAERSFAAVYQPPPEKMHRKALREIFDIFCRAAVQAGALRLVVDELADVTEPGWAPAGWEIVTRQGRHARLEIQAASQRPADVDKSFYGNATRVVVFRLNADGDLDRMARVMRRPADELASLAPLEYLERDMRSGLVVKKKIEPRDFRRIPA